MGLPYISISKVEGSARPLTAASTKALIIGPCSSGVKETRIYTFSNTSDVVSTIGYGNAQLAADLYLSLAPPGYGSVDVVVASGSNGTITLVSAASPTIIPSGTAYASYDLRVEITKTGALGTGKFKYSLDGGDSYSDSILIPLAGTYTVSNTGVTLTFAAGTHTAGSISHYDIQGPMMTAAYLASCINTLSNSNTTYTNILVADDSPSAVSGAALFSAMDGHLTTLANTYYKFTQAVVNVGGETYKYNRSHALTPGSNTYTTVLSNITASASSTGNMIAAVAEKANTYVGNPTSGYTSPRLPFAFIVGAELHATGRNLSKKIDLVRRVKTPSYDDFKNGTVYVDEKIIAPRTDNGVPGIMVNDAQVKTAPNSTYNIWPKGRIINRAAEVVRAAVRPFLHTHVRTLTDGTGRIDPRDKAFIETAVSKQIRAALLLPTNEQGTHGYITDFSFSINGETNVLSTGQLECTTIIVPFAYLREITVDIGLSDTISVVPVPTT
jgi:hypothetical protein